MKRIAQAILSAMLHAMAWLPFWALYAVADVVFVLLYYLVRYRRKVVRKNLAESFPEKSERERSAIARRFYRNFADYIVETVKLLHISDSEMSRRMVFENMDLINELLGSGRSVVVYFAHCFNWEWAPSVTLHLDLTIDEQVVAAQVYRPLRDKWFDALMLRVRGRFRSHSYPKHTVLRDMIKLRRSGVPSITGFMSDQKPSHGDPTYVTRFLNHPTAMITGTETLARRLGMAAVYWDMEKLGRGRYRITNRLIADDAAELEPMEVTRRYAQMLEATIRRNPSIWLWTHKRWKIPVNLDPDETTV